jgi:hypothetical protein
MRTAVALVAAFFASLYLAAPAPAADEGGEVKEIIIKIQTEDGEKWFRLGKDLEAINIHEGDYVQFDYADDDTIEAIEVEEASPPEQSSTGTQ